MIPEPSMEFDDNTVLRSHAPSRLFLRRGGSAQCITPKADRRVPILLLPDLLFGEAPESPLLYLLSAEILFLALPSTSFAVERRMPQQQDRTSSAVPLEQFPVHAGAHSTHLSAVQSAAPFP